MKGEVKVGTDITWLALGDKVRLLAHQRTHSDRNLKQENLAVVDLVIEMTIAAMIDVLREVEETGDLDQI